MRKYILIILMIVLLPMSSLAKSNDKNEDPSITYGPTFDLSCVKTDCSIAIYDEQENFYNETNGTWDKINESFYDCGNAFCTRSYYFDASVGDDGTVKTSVDGSTFALRLSSINNEKIDYTSYIKDNEVIFPQIITNTELRYTFLYDRLKETMTLFKPPTIAKGQDTWNISYEILGDPILDIGTEIICDQKENCIKVEVKNNKTNLLIDVPTSYLNDINTVYPVIIDPSQTFNGTPNTTFSGHIAFDTISTYTRTSDPTQIFIGENQTGVLFTDYRAALEFNVSVLPVGITITNVNLRIFVFTLGNNNNDIISFVHMDGNNYTYTNDNAGNQLYFNDTGNGTSFKLSTLGTGQNNINLTSAAQSINDSVNSSSGIFSVGLWAPFAEGGVANITGKQSTGLRSRVFGAPNNRPLLNITFTINSICPPSGTHWIITSLCEVNGGTYSPTTIDIASPGRLVLNNVNILTRPRITITGGNMPTSLAIQGGNIIL